MKLWPISPLVDTYLEAARENHEGHEILDYAALLGITQNLVNRHYITVGNHPLTVSFLLSGNSGVWARNALDFAFRRFLKGSFEDQEIAPQGLRRFFRVDGFNTPAGLMDTINAESDPWGRQICTFYADNTCDVFQTSRSAKHSKADLNTFYNALLSGTAYIRRVRESTRNRKADEVPYPITNAVWASGKKDLPLLFVQAPVTNRLLLLAPDAADRKVRVFPEVDCGALYDAFNVFQNFLELNKGTPDAPSRVQLTAEALERMHTLLDAEFARDAEDQVDFFTHHRTDFVLLAAQSALLRLSLVIDPDDVQRAYGLLCASLVAKQSTLVNDRNIELTIPQKQRREVTERLAAAIELSGKAGLSRSELYKKVSVFKHFKQDERDEFVAALKDSSEVFQLTLVTGKHRTETRFFVTSVWSLEEAALVLPIEPPVQIEHGTWRDVRGDIHTTLEACYGYRPEWLTA